MSLRAASGSALTSRPSNSNAPLDGVSTHPRMCISVDFPQPDGPQMATYSAGSIRSETPRTAVTGPAGIANTLVISRASMMDIVQLSALSVDTMGSRATIHIGYTAATAIVTASNAA